MCGECQGRAGMAYPCLGCRDSNLEISCEGSFEMSWCGWRKRRLPLGSCAGRQALHVWGSRCLQQPIQQMRFNPR